MRTPRRSWMLPALAAIAAVTVFALLSVALLREQLRQLDDIGERWVSVLRSWGADTFWIATTWTGSLWILVPLCLLVSWWLYRRRRVSVVPVLVAPAAAFVAQNVLKPLFGRLRPEGGVLAELGPAFPSGHSMSSAAVWLTLTYVLVRERVLPPMSMFVAVFLVALVGISRVYLDVHWPSDVLAGWSVGVAIAGVCMLVYERSHAGPYA